MIRLMQGFAIAVLASPICLGQTLEAVRILGVVPGEAGELDLRLSFPDSLHGTQWQLFRCEPEAGDPSPLWRPIGTPIVLSSSVNSVPLVESVSPVALFLLKQTGQAGGEVAQAMRLSRVPAPDGSAALLRVELLDVSDTQLLFATGFEELEGIRLGALAAELEWNVVGDGRVCGERG